MQLTLGKLIKELEAVKPNVSVRFDFCGLLPRGLHCYRGYYQDIAIGYGIHEYWGGEVKSPQSVAEFLQLLRFAIGGVFQGWKGGDFLMNEDTLLWVDNPGECHATALVGVVDNDYEVILITEWQK